MRKCKCILTVIILMLSGIALGQEIREARPGAWRDGRSSDRRDRHDRSDADRNSGNRNTYDRSGRNHGHTASNGNQQSDWGRGRGGNSGMDMSDPQYREQLYGRMVDYYIERMDRRYGLSQEQKTKVRTRLDEIKQEQLSYSKQHSQEYQKLRDESRKLRDSARASGQAEDAQVGEIRNRYHALRDGAPLMNSQRITQEVEKLLPSEQVAQGRAKHEAEHAERALRRDRDGHQHDQSRQRNSRNDDQTATPPSDQGDQAEQSLPSEQRGHGRDNMRTHRNDDRHGMRRSWQGRTRNGDEHVAASDQSSPSSTDGHDDNSRQSRTRTVRENPISPWEQYVRDFIKLYNLDEAQQATAWSIHREMQERRTAYEQSHRFDYHKAKQIEDIGQREHRLKELNSPVVRSFDELKMRLMRIPSSAQRQAAGINTSTTRPAASSRPS